MMEATVKEGTKKIGVVNNVSRKFKKNKDRIEALRCGEEEEIIRNLGKCWFSTVEVAEASLKQVKGGERGQGS